MPRTSPYSITLAEAERTELEARARRYTSSYSEVVRARIVLYAADGLGNDEIAARLDTPRQVVSKWRKRFFDAASGRTDRSASGRTAPEFFPLTSWSLSRRWPANCRRRRTRRWPAGSAPTWPAPPSSPASSPRSRAPRSGAGSVRTRSSPGSTAPGSSPATPTSVPRRPGCSTSTAAASATPRCSPTSS